MYMKAIFLGYAKGNRIHWASLTNEPVKQLLLRMGIISVLIVYATLALPFSSFTEIFKEMSLPPCQAD